MNAPRNIFHKAIDGLETHHRRFSFARFLAEHITLAHKFAMPDAGHMTDGLEFDRFKESLQLPYDRVALLREIEVDGEHYQQVCLAVAAHLVPYGLPVDFYVADCILVSSAHNAWSPSPPVGIEIHRDKPGVTPYYVNSMLLEEQALYGPNWAGVRGANKGFGALNGLVELMVMLSLSNVSTKVVEPPTALNKKRARQGKLPLYAYHVLLIDGKETAAHGDEGRDADIKIRSHFRRGHIRRLDQTRRVWVRAAYVHGRADGFVDKDYKVTGMTI